MNEILQKRIEEKSKELGQMFFPDNMNVFARPNWEAGYIETACKEIAKYALQNQWISVEEALPPYDDRLKTISIDVIVMNEYGKATSAWYDYANKVWHLLYGEIAGDDVLDSKITHWMTIPQLKGGEE